MSKCTAAARGKSIGPALVAYADHANNLTALRRAVAEAVPPRGFPYSVGQILLRYGIGQQTLAKWIADPGFPRGAVTSAGPGTPRFFDPEKFDQWLYEQPRIHRGPEQRWRSFVDEQIARRQRKSR